MKNRATENKQATRAGRWGAVWHVMNRAVGRVLHQKGPLLVGLATGAVFPAFASPPVHPQPVTERPPNIVLILADDVGYGDISSYGATQVHTPQIDSLAQTGLKFTNAHSAAATCTPSRYSILTGDYAWRRDGVHILPGDAKALIAPGQATIASVLHDAGYKTGLVGKWHLGLGDGAIDWNGAISPGPHEAGFDNAFFFAATADRVPTVYIHDHHVVGLDPSDPIRVSYDQPIGHDPTGRSDPELLKMKLSEGHDGTIVDGVSRIGFMSGGRKARWKDEEMAATFTRKATDFIEENQSRPFFLYFAPSDIHVPRMPSSMFANKSRCGVRCDVIKQLDWSVGQILLTLHRLHLDQNTLVVFTSDNGPVVNDGYNDGADRALNGHRPAGPWSGGKYSILEGGTRVPFLVRWSGHVQSGVSSALMGQVDLLASYATIAHAVLPKDRTRDSQDQSRALLGNTNAGRTSLVEEAQVLALVAGDWKLVDKSQKPGTPSNHNTRQAGDLALYNLSTDPGEKKNIADRFPQIAQRLSLELQSIRQGM